MQTRNPQYRNRNPEPRPKVCRTFPHAYRSKSLPSLSSPLPRPVPTPPPVLTPPEGVLKLPTPPFRSRSSSESSEPRRVSRSAGDGFSSAWRRRRRVSRSEEVVRDITKAYMARDQETSRCCVHDAEANGQIALFLEGQVPSKRAGWRGRRTALKPPSFTEGPGRSNTAKIKNWARYAR